MNEPLAMLRSSLNRVLGRGSSAGGNRDSTGPGGAGGYYGRQPGRVRVKAERDRSIGLRDDGGDAGGTHGAGAGSLCANEPSPLLLRPFAFGTGLLVANAITIRLYPAGSRMTLAGALTAWGAACEIAHYVLLYAGLTVQKTGGPSGGAWSGAGRAGSDAGAIRKARTGTFADRGQCGGSGDRGSGASAVFPAPGGGAGNRSPVIAGLQMLGPPMIMGSAIVAVI
jgi:hypothetical protein